MQPHLNTYISSQHGLRMDLDYYLNAQSWVNTYDLVVAAFSWMLEICLVESARQDLRITYLQSIHYIRPHRGPCQLCLLGIRLNDCKPAPTVNVYYNFLAQPKTTHPVFSTTIYHHPCASLPPGRCLYPSIFSTTLDRRWRERLNSCTPCRIGRAAQSALSQPP